MCVNVTTKYVWLYIHILKHWKYHNKILYIEQEHFEETYL
jgi:hypothetical protein